jgi:hypothetical protein
MSNEDGVERRGSHPTRPAFDLPLAASDIDTIIRVSKTEEAAIAGPAGEREVRFWRPFYHLYFNSVS